MEIEISDYLDEEEIKEMVKDSVRSLIARKFNNEKSLERIISNAAYVAVSSACDDVFDEPLKDKLNKNVSKVVDDLSSFTVFSKPDAWGREPNNMYNYLQSVIANHKPTIAKIIKENIEQATMTELKLSLEDKVIEAVQGLFKNS